jgi:hypothetical protein
MPPQEDEVRSASARFYLALNRMANGDDSSIAAAWSQGQAVTTMHPVTGRQVGRDQVRESGDWKLVHHHSDHSPAMMAALDRLSITTSAAR